MVILSETTIIQTYDPEGEGRYVEAFKLRGMSLAIETFGSLTIDGQPWVVTGRAVAINTRNNSIVTTISAAKE